MWISKALIRLLSLRQRRIRIVLAGVILLSLFSEVALSAPRMSEAQLKAWMNSDLEPWQAEMDGLWPDVRAMIEVAYPKAKSGSVKAQVVVAEMIIMLEGLPPETQVAGKSLADLKFDVLKLLSSTSAKASGETLSVIEIMRKRLGVKEQ